MTRVTSIRNLTTGTLVAALVGLAIFSLRNRERDGSELAKEEFKLRTLARTQAEALRKSQHSALASPSHGQDTPNVPKRTTPKSTPPVATAPANMKQWRQNPELLNLRLTAERAKLSNLCAPLFARLRLEPEAQSKLLDLKMHAEEQKADLDAAISEGRLSYTDPSVWALQKQIQSELDAGALALLGKDSFQSYHEFDRALPVRESITALLGTAEVHGVPFTAEQAEAIVDFAVATAKSPEAVEVIYPSFINWDEVRRKAQGMLSPTQLDALTHFEPTPTLMSFSGPSFGRFNQLVNEGLAQDRKKSEPQPKG